METEDLFRMIFSFSGDCLFLCFWTTANTVKLRSQGFYSALVLSEVPSLCTVKTEDTLHSFHHFMYRRRKKHFILRLLGKAQNSDFWRQTVEKMIPQQKAIFPLKITIKCPGFKSTQCFCSPLQGIADVFC